MDENVGRLHCSLLAYFTGQVNPVTLKGDMQLLKPAQLEGLKLLKQ
jgi:hypothetical protein